jgi:hypothetical protein
MERLYERIRRAVREERVVFTVHADERLWERKVERWHLLESFESGAIIQAHRGRRTEAKVLVQQVLPSGEEVIAVWTYVRSIECAKLITVYFE